MALGIYVKINDVLYPATIGGRLNDKDWDNRESKFITLEMTYEDATKLFVEDLEWSIVQEVEERIEHHNEETNETTYETIVRNEVFDNSDYSMVGDITIHNNGTITVKMGKPTAEELLAVILGGIE